MSPFSRESSTESDAKMAAMQEQLEQVTADIADAKHQISEDDVELVGVGPITPTGRRQAPSTPSSARRHSVWSSMALSLDLESEPG